MKISAEEKLALNKIIQAKINENLNRSAFTPVDGGMVDTELVSEHVTKNPLLDESLDNILNDVMDQLDERLALAISRAMTKLNENTSVSDVKMYVDNGQEQIDEVAEEVMSGVKQLLETYVKAFTAIVCEVANEPAIDEIVNS